MHDDFVSAHAYATAERALDITAALKIFSFRAILRAKLLQYEGQY